MDPVSDMLIRIKNGGEAGKSTVVVSSSKFKYAIAQLLLREGYIAGVSRKGKGVKRILELKLAENEEGKPKIKGVKRVSKLSRRVYTASAKIRSIRQGYGNVVLSTPKGIFTGKEAKKAKVGGELLFEIW